MKLIYHHRASEATATGCSATETATAKATARTHTRSHTGTLTIEAGAATLLLTRILTTEEIQTVDGVEHDVGVDAVVLCVGALHGIDDTAEVALLVQDVIELQ